MHIAIDERLDDLDKKTASIAKQVVAPRHDLSETEQFPHDIWKKLGHEKLLGIGVPETYGGLNEDYAAMAIAGENLVKHGHNLGIVLSWLLQNVVARFLIVGFGNKRQHGEILSKMVDGGITAAFAVSEPGAGAHPKRLTTSATPDDDGFVINGEKTYLTNGPIANLFVVIAITGHTNGRKQYSAFLVPEDTPGLIVSEPMVIAALRPSPHGGITLDNCFVPSSSILGNKNTAYEDMVKPFREVEDVLMMGPLAGGAAWQMEIVLGLLDIQKIELTDDQKADVGRLQSLIHSLRIMAHESAAMLDGTPHSLEHRALIIAFRSIFKDIQSLFNGLILNCSIATNTELDGVTRDLNFSGQIASNTAKILEVRYGEYVLKKGSLPD